MNGATFILRLYVFTAWTAITSFFYLPTPSDTHITASIGRKVKFILATGHEGPKGKQRHSSILSLTWKIDGVDSQRHDPAALPPGMTPVPIA